MLPYTPPPVENMLGVSRAEVEKLKKDILAMAPAPEPKPELTNTVRMRDDENMTTTPKPSPPPAKREPFARRDVLNYILAHPGEDLSISDITAGTGRLETSVISVLARLRADAEIGALGIDGHFERVGKGAYRYTPAPVTTRLAEQYAPGAPGETPAASNGHVTPAPVPAPVPAPPSKRLWEEFGVTSRGVILAQDEDGALWKVEEIDL